MRRGLVIALLVAVFGLATWQVLKSFFAPPVVKLVPVTNGVLVEAIYATGRVATDRLATVRARFAAPLESMLVGPGESVKRGQVVAVQDNREVLLELAKKESELAAANAAATEARDAAQRLEQLFVSGLIPESELVRARERAQELTKKAEAFAQALNLAREQLTWVTLRSPMDGTVANLVRRSGDLLQVGDEILTVVDLSEAYLRVAVDERDLGKVQLGQEVRIVFDAYPDEVLVGKVWRIVPTVDRLTRSADVLVHLPSHKPLLKLDLTATVNIVTKSFSDVSLVPKRALVSSANGVHVLRIGHESRLEAVSVTVGACDMERCQLISGPPVGDLIVADPTNLKPGLKVKLL